MPHRPTNKEGLPAVRRACGNCGRLGHLTRTCTRTAKAHDKLGVEIEGWWLRGRWSEVERTAENWHMAGTDDGSLDACSGYKAYEFRTRPGSLGEQISQVTAVYPDAYHSSAGMHVHMSLKSHHDISSLNSLEFFAYFRERWEAWGTRMGVHPESQFWKRLHGRNDYCRVNCRDDLNTEHMLRGDRYNQLNFTAWSRHKTMEMRMLPLFRDAKLAVSALEEWVTIVEDFLDIVAPSQVWAKYDRTVSVSGDSTSYREIESEIEISTTARTEEIARDLDLSVHFLNPRLRSLGTFPSQRTMTIECDLSASVDERTNSVDLPSVTPHTPGHVRVFGNAARQLEAQIRTYAPRALQGV